MRIVGHGIDLVEIQSIKDELESESQWAEKVCSERERMQADKPPQHSRYYAGRFAGKEAVSKALGTGFAGDITWRGIEILRTDSGAPEVHLSGAVQDFATSLGITSWMISLSYSDALVIASAIAIAD